MRRAPSREELREARLAAVTYVQSLRYSRQKALDVVQDAFEKAMTTRRWDADRVSFKDQVIGVVRSLLSHERDAATDRNEREAARGFHDEVVGRRAKSMEEDIVEREEWGERDDDFEGLYERLAARVASHELAPEVLRCRRGGVERPADIAEALGVTVDRVYRANETLKIHLLRIREEDHD